MWSAAHQTALWGGPGPRFEPGTGSIEAGTQATWPPTLLTNQLCYLMYYNCANVHFCYFYLWFNAFVLPCTRSTMHYTTLHLCYFELKLSCTINFCFQALFHLCSTLRCCAFLLTHTWACATLQFANIVNSIMSLCIIALVLLFTSANVRLCYTDTPMSFLSHVLL